MLFTNLAWQTVAKLVEELLGGFQLWFSVFRVHREEFVKRFIGYL